jgi:hypothetical protein
MTGERKTQSLVIFSLPTLFFFACANHLPSISLFSLRFLLVLSDKPNPRCNIMPTKNKNSRFSNELSWRRLAKNDACSMMGELLSGDDKTEFTAAGLSAFCVLHKPDRDYFLAARRSARVAAWYPALMGATDREEPQSWQCTKYNRLTLSLLRVVLVDLHI